VSTVPLIGVLGLGEAGSLVAVDLVGAGADVVGFDPRVPVLDGVVTVAGDAEAAGGRDVVLALTAAEDAPAALAGALPGLASGALYADLSTGPDGLKRSLAGEVASAGAQFADVAIMSPVPGKGLQAPMLASGDGADRFAEVVNGLGGQVTVVPGGPGEAARRKLLRSVFYKGMGAALVEAHEAAEAAGLGAWLLDHVGGELEAMTRETASRLLEGSHRHAVRREAEMAAAGEVVRGLGVPSPVSDAARAVLGRLAVGRGDGEP
jgi:3-hydroxyisobutyrate dehydrogenase-like beta-hydroxyacid dehydrogenase